MSYNVTPLDSSPMIGHLTKIDIDGKTTGATTIYTTLEDNRFVPLFINIESTSVSGVITPPTIAIGTNETSYNNIKSGTLLSANANNDTQNLEVASVITSVAPSTDIKVNVTIGAVATTYILRVTLIGFYY
jgi:hypothetical protein